MRHYDPDVLAGLLPFPRPNANKYTRGRLILVGGSESYPGAVSLAALASQRMGAGYTEVFTDGAVVPQVQSYHPSLVVRPWTTWDTARTESSTPDKPCAYVLGCGFDVDDASTPTLTRRLLRGTSAPVVVDGGALRLLSARKMRDLSAKRYREGLSTVITPHAGEAKQLARMFGLATREPDELCLQLAQAYGVTCVLKGPDTFISDGEDTLAMREGSAALAKAGTGDVLAGMIGALLAQDLDPVDACVLATVLHARAGFFAAEEMTAISVCAEDVVRHIPTAIKSFIDGEAAYQRTERSEALHAHPDSTGACAACGSATDPSGMFAPVSDECEGGGHTCTDAALGVHGAARAAAAAAGVAGASGAACATGMFAPVTAEGECDPSDYDPAAADYDPAAAGYDDEAPGFDGPKPAPRAYGHRTPPAPSPDDVLDTSDPDAMPPLERTCEGIDVTGEIDVPRPATHDPLA